jgi:hypothetical protein
VSPARTSASMFPLPVLDRLPRPATSSRRCCSRVASANAVIDCYNETADSLHRLERGPDSPERIALSLSGLSMPEPAGDAAFTKQQDRAAASLHAVCERFVCRRRECDSAATPAVPRPSIFTDSTITDGRVSITDYATTRSQAVPLVADRVALPADSSDAIDLSQALPPATAELYSSLNPNLVGDLAKAKGQPAAFLASRIEYAKLIRRLIALGMVRLSRHALVVNGIFCVPKDSHWLRLIVDCRRANAVFADPAPLSLPTPDILAALRLPHGRRVKVAHSDVDNAFHRMKLPVWMQPYFSLPAVRAGDIGAGDEFGADTLIYPLLTRLPMGFSHSPFLCQEVHSYIVKKFTRLTAADEIRADTDLVVDRPRWCVYLDDFTMAGPDDCDVDGIFEEYLQAMKSNGLPAKPSKVQPPAVRAESLGLEFDCKEGTVGVSPRKLQALRAETDAFLARGMATGYELSALLGKWTWAMLVRRPALACFGSVYRFVDTARSRRFRIWRSVEWELRIAMGLAPLLYANIAAPWAPIIVATDASEYGQGVVARAAEPAEAEREAPLARKTPSSAPEEQEGEEGRRRSRKRRRRVQLTDQQRADLEEAAVAEGWWSEIVSARWRFADSHINTFELRAMLTAVRWLASRPGLRGTRVLLLSDSAVCVAAVAKGRSSSFALLRILRQLTATLFASNIALWPRWLPSERNPADEASRR